MIDYLKIGKATDLTGRDYKIYRFLETIPGLLSFGTLFLLILLSYLTPVFVAYFLIAFDVYWLLYVIYMAIYLVVAYHKVKVNMEIDWPQRCRDLAAGLDQTELPADCLAKQGLTWKDVYHLVILPTYNEDVAIIKTALQSLIDDGFPREQLIVAVAMEERAGAAALGRAEIIRQEFSDKFKDFLITFHPDNIPGELKGKGANQAWCARAVREQIVDKQQLPYDKIMVSIFDIDTVIKPGYFSVLTYKFLTVSKPYNSSYQPVPIYNNNIWGAPFFSQVAAASNTFWQMMMQIRREKLVTYSSHSMTWQTLVKIDFWSPNMVSEDSRIFFHCLLYYGGDYRVEPLYFFVSMDATDDKTFLSTAKSLYKQQRRWAWGAESVPYLIFNYWKLRGQLKDNKNKKNIFYQIGVQVYGFYSWATNALMIAVIGWMPMLLGGNRFNSTVLSGNLPYVSQSLMNWAMIGIVLSTIVSNLLLPKRPAKYSIWKSFFMVIEWIFVPVSIVIFGAIPCLDAQYRLMVGKYMGFWVTPKERHE
jgi:hypothetical protein